MQFDVITIPDTGGDLNSSDVSASLVMPQRLLTIVENYINYYASGTGHTARAKQYDLRHFVEFLSQQAGIKPEQLLVSHWTYQQTRDFIEQRLSNAEAPATVSRRLATLKHLGRTLAERVPGFINPAREAKGPTLHIAKPHGLQDNEIQLLLRAADELCTQNKQTFTTIRNRFLLRLLLSTGLRADEVRLLVMNQIANKHKWLKNVRTKGKKFRNVYLDSHIRLDLQDYLTCRMNFLIEQFPRCKDMSSAEMGSFPVLLSAYNGDPTQPSSLGVSPKTIWRVISNIGQAAQSLALNLTPYNEMPNLHPHKLRHTFAHGLLDSSKDVRLVAQALGHSDVRTTMRYTQRSDEQLAVAIEEKCKHPT